MKWNFKWKKKLKNNKKKRDEMDVDIKVRY